MSGKVACPRCGCAEIDKDAATGGAYCTSCGSVLEENAIVAEVEFFETGSGGHGALGQFVSADAPSKLRIGTLPGISTKESREVTLQRARRLIHELASQLGGLNQHCKDTALNFVGMAIRGGYTRGRRSTHVIAACLYITCRLEATPHLLLDFSDALQVNVFELGKVYNFLARKLLIRLPQLDPCDYIMRFAHCLNFGDKEHEVAMVALRLVQRMKRDWMSFGRRPTGLCGAALLLASRYHNFKRTVTDIVQVVNISETVVRKRLEEFASTPSSELTLDEFQSVDLEQTCDPPAFREARSKAKRTTQPNKHQQNQIYPENEFWNTRFKSLEKQLLATEAAVDAALSAASPSKRHPLARYAKSGSGSGSKSAAAENGRASASSSVRLGTDGDESLPCQTIDDEIEQDEQVRSFVDQQVISDIIEDVEVAGSSTSGTSSTTEMTPAERYRALRPTLESLGITTRSTVVPADADTSKNNTTDTAAAATADEDDGALVTEDIDDEEIDTYILNPDEVKMKEELWVANYEEFMAALEEKRKQKEEERQKEEQEGGGKKKKAVVKRKRPAHAMEAASSASEAIEKIVQEKKLSNKINYEVLKSLVVTESPRGPNAAGQQTDTTTSDTTPSTTGAPTPAPAPSAAGNPPTATAPSRRSMTRFKPYIAKKA